MYLYLLARSERAKLPLVLIEAKVYYLNHHLPRRLPFKKPGEPGRERPVISKPPQPPVDSHAVDRPPIPLETLRNRTSSVSSQCSSSSSLVTERCAESSVSSDPVKMRNENTAKVVSARSSAEYSDEPAATSDFQKEQIILGVGADLTLSIGRSPAASEASHSSAASAVTVKRASLSSASPAKDDLSVGGGRTLECEVNKVTSNVPGGGLFAEEIVETMKIEDENVVEEKDTDYSHQTEKTPVKNNRIPSPPRPTRVVHGGIRTKAFFSNLPVQQNSSVSDVDASTDQLAITAAPIENSKSTTENNSSQLHGKDVKYEITVSSGGSDKETLIDSPSCGSAQEETECYETCSEDGTEQFTEDNSSLVAKSTQVVDTGNNNTSNKKDCEESHLETPSVESNHGLGESKVMPETDEAGKQDTPEDTLTETEPTEKADVSCSDQIAVSEDVGCEITIEKDEEKLEIKTTLTIPDDSPDITLEDKAKVEVAPEVDKENVPPPLADATPDIEENLAVDGMFEENYSYNEDNDPEGETSGS